DHPDFVTLATRAGLPTLLAVSGWPPLALPEDGGPLFAEASRREFVPVPEPSPAGEPSAAETAAETHLTTWDAADEATTRLAAAILAEDAPRVSFVYLGAVRFRRAYQRENGTIVVVTDRGHLDGGGHGGREPEVATAWAAAAGPGIRPDGPPLITRQEEVAPLVLAVAGWPPGQE